MRCPACRRGTTGARATGGALALSRSLRNQPMASSRTSGLSQAQRLDSKTGQIVTRSFPSALCPLVLSSAPDALHDAAVRRPADHLLVRRADRPRPNKNICIVLERHLPASSLVFTPGARPSLVDNTPASCWPAYTRNHVFGRGSAQDREQAPGPGLQHHRQ